MSEWMSSNTSVILRVAKDLFTLELFAVNSNRYNGEKVLGYAQDDKPVTSAV